MLPTLKIPSDLVLPDNKQYQFRFEIKSETSNNVYIISQHKEKKHWGCSCPGWRRFRHCKHLDALNLPGDMKPHEVQFVKE